MYQILSDHLDQLDLALDQLALKDRNYDRFSLMLIDNVAELILHQFAEDCLNENNQYADFSKSKYDPVKLQKALGRKFTDKTKFAMNNGLIESKYYEAINNLHRFRNIAYHQGRRYEEILHAISIFYFKIVCDILIAYKPRYISFGSMDNISYRATKYIGKPNFLEFKNCFTSAFARIKEVAESLEEI